MRQELPPTTDTVYRHRNYPRGITPREIQGLQAVLAVVRAVAGNFLVLVNFDGMHHNFVLCTFVEII